MRLSDGADGYLALECMCRCWVRFAWAADEYGILCPHLAVVDHAVVAPNPCYYLVLGLPAFLC